MVSNGFISTKFKKIAEQANIIDLYNSEKFAKYYHDSINGDKDFFEDISFYQSIFTDKSNVLEIGSGTGRVLIPLIDHNINIFGIEPSIEMANFIPIEYKKRLFCIGIEELKRLRKFKSYLDAIIIPATSISVFPHEVFEQFLSDALSLLKPGGKIYFDYIKTDHFKQLDNIVNTVVNNSSKYYMTNFIVDKKIIFNITDKLDFAVGIKYLYSNEYVSSVAEKFNMKFIVDKDLTDYTMVHLELA